MGAAGARTTLVAEDEEFPRGRTCRQRRPKQSCLDLVDFLAGGGHDAEQPIEFLQGGLLKKDGGPGWLTADPFLSFRAKKPQTPNPEGATCRRVGGSSGR